MKVIILCGGQGTRIRDVSDSVPKPMIPIGGFPILWHIMKGYSAFGHQDFVLCLGYKGSVIREFFLNYEANIRDFTVTLGRDRAIEYHDDTHDEAGWKVTLAETGEDSLTATRVRRICRHLDNDETFLLTYGDGVSDVDLDAALAFHRAHGKLITVTGVRPPGRFGEMNSDDTGRVLEFNEKPQATGGLISGGFFICQRGVLDYLGTDENMMFEQEPLRRLVADGQLMVHRHDGFWQCMDTARDYTFLNDLWAAGKAPWKRW